MQQPHSSECLALGAALLRMGAAEAVHPLFLAGVSGTMRHLADAISLQVRAAGWAWLLQQREHGCVALCVCSRQPSLPPPTPHRCRRWRRCRRPTGGAWWRCPHPWCMSAWSA